MAVDPVPSNKGDVPWPPLAVFRTTVRDWTRLRKFQVKFRDMLTLEPEDCCASGLGKILEDSGRAPDMLFPHVSPTHSIYIKNAVSAQGMLNDEIERCRCTSDS